MSFVYIRPTETNNGVTTAQMVSYVGSQTALLLPLTGGQISNNLQVDNNLNDQLLSSNKVLLSDSLKNIISSSISNTTLSYLDATSSIQTQFNTINTTLGSLGTTYVPLNGNSTITGITTLSGTTVMALPVGTNNVFQASGSGNGLIMSYTGELYTSYNTLDNGSGLMNINGLLCVVLRC